jgi:hypothetical protein
MRFWWKKKKCLQGEGVDSISIVLEHLCEIFIQPVEFHFISRLVIKRGLKLIISTIGSTIQKEEVGIQTPPPPHPRPIGIISSASPINKGLSLEIFIQDV